MFGIGSIWKNIEKIRGTLIGDLPKFGSGSMKRECEECDHITVFMVCYGQATSEKRRMIVPKNTTLKTIKGHFGRPMSQEVVADENYFIFNEDDLNKPVYMFSNKCCLSLSFCYDSQNARFTIQIIKQCTPTSIFHLPAFVFISIICKASDATGVIQCGKTSRPPRNIQSRISPAIISMFGSKDSSLFSLRWQSFFGFLFSFSRNRCEFPRATGEFFVLYGV